MDENNKEKYVDYFDIAYLLSIIRKGWKTLLTVTCICGFLSVLYALSLPNIYKSETLLASSSESQNDISGALSGLVSGMGLNINQVADRTNFAIEILKSKDFFEYLYNDEKFLVELAAVKEVKKGENQVIIDESIYNVESNSWLPKEDSITKLTKPSLLEAKGKFASEHFSISRNQETGFLSLSVQHLSPYIAQDWLLNIVRSINSYIQLMEIGEVNKSIAYLEKQISKTNNPDVKRLISTILEQQMKTLMLSEVSDGYILKVMDSAFLPEKKSGPARSKICITLTMMGFMLAYILLVLWDLNKERMPFRKD